MKTVQFTRYTVSIEVRFTQGKECCDCGKPFEGFTAKSNGKQYTAAQAYHMSEKKHGRALCGECAAKAKEAEHE